MIRNTGTKVLFILFVAVSAFAASAEQPVITADQVEDRLQEGGKVVIVDVRSLEEYRDGHVPGAINIPAERITIERARLPRDKASTVIFYCRGAG
jgi:phage shock protein E